MPLIFMEHFTPATCRDMPDAIFVFGDNIIRKGCKGQACIRYCANSFGIPTKHLPAKTPQAYYKDADFPYVENVISRAFDQLEMHLRNGKTVVWPENNIGVSLAKLPIKAPAIYAYIMERLEKLKDISNLSN